jgi:hypothetical protein
VPVLLAALLSLGVGACAPSGTPQDLATASAPRQLSQSPAAGPAAGIRESRLAPAELRWWQDARDYAGSANRTGSNAALAINAYTATRGASDARLLHDACAKLAAVVGDLRAYRNSPDRPAQQLWASTVGDFVAASDACTNGARRHDVVLLRQAETRLDAAFVDSKRLAVQVGKVIGAIRGG